MGPDRALMEAAIRHLESFERPSASPGERAAAEWIADALREAGLEPVIEEGRAHGGFWWPLGLLTAIALIGGRLRLRPLGRALAAAAAVAMADDLDHRSRWFRRAFLPHRPTHNVFAVAGDPEAARTVLVVAHHDAAHGGRIFDTTGLAAIKRRAPGLYDRFDRWPPLMWAVIAPSVLVALGERRHSTRLGLGVLAAMADIARSPVAPGANDNLSAVGALLALARRLRDEPAEGLRVILLSTGSEESNSEGMQEYGRAHFAELPRETTDVIALECLGSGTVTVPESEGFLVPHHYDAGLKELATACGERLGVEIRRGLHIVFASDAQIALHAGYRAMTLAATDELRLPANYHKPTDTADNLDFACLDRAADVLEATVRAIAAQARSSSARAAATAS
jgi:acetylornithine deacetylase/succinyl-diaminopimelate desuccinylase-like protein